MKKATPALLLAGLAVSACLQAQAAEPQANQPQAAADTGSALMVGIDAKTGKLRALTPAETRALAAKAATMPRGKANWALAPQTPAQARATVRKRPDGSMSMRTPISAMSSSQVVRDANGNLIFSEGVGDTLPTAPARQEVTE